MYETLFSEWQVGKHTIKNRIDFCSPVTGFSREGQPTTRLMAYYLERAKGGAGLIELEPGLRYQESRIGEWSDLVEQVHAYGAGIAAAVRGDVNTAELSVICRAGFDGVALHTGSGAEMSRFRQCLAQACGDLLIGLHVHGSDSFTTFDRGADYVVLYGDDKRIHNGINAPIVKSVTFPDPASCEALLYQRGADMVALSRQLVCDPFWPLKAELCKGDDIRRCDLLKEDSAPFLGSIRCALNPYLGYESSCSESSMPLASQPKTVVVVGGGPSGMQAAITASQRGHSVFLLENADDLGGSLLPQNSAAAAWLISETKRNHVDVRLGLPVTAGHIAALDPQAVIMAIGENTDRKQLVSALREKKIMVTKVNNANCSIGQSIRNGFQVAAGI